MYGIARIRNGTFSDLKQDTSRLADKEALLVTLLVGLSLGLGEIIAFSLSDLYSIVTQLFYSTLLIPLTSTIWTGIIFLIGTRIFKGSTDFLGLARPIFFSVTPGIFFVFTSMPLIRPMVATVIAGWVVLINVFIVKES